MATPDASRLNVNRGSRLDDRQGGNEQQEFSGGLLVTRFEDAQDPDAPVMAVHLTLVAPPYGVIAGISGSFTTLQ